MLNLSRNIGVLAAQSARFFQTTRASQILDHEWRRKNRKTVNPNTESPLTFLPDFSYMDGRPAPLGKNQKRRLEKQRMLAKYMVKGLSELEFAEKRYERIEKEKEQQRSAVLGSKLKQKGHKLFEKSPSK